MRLPLCVFGLWMARFASLRDHRPIRHWWYQGFDVYANGVLLAPIRLAAQGAIVANTVVTNANGLRLSGLQTKDPLAVIFSTNDFVSITLPPAGVTNWEPVVQFQLTLGNFNTNRWLAMFPEGAAPFHFLVCPMPTAQVWHQRGWLNATPYADPFPLLGMMHEGTPEISCLWNRNWSYICPLGEASHDSDDQACGIRRTACMWVTIFRTRGRRIQSERLHCRDGVLSWGQGGVTNFITLAYPYGRGCVTVRPGLSEMAGRVLASWFSLEINPSLPATEDPNEQCQQRLFARYTNSLPRVPAMNDLGWLPGQVHLSDFAGPIGVTTYGPDPNNSFIIWPR